MSSQLADTIDQILAGTTGTLVVDGFNRGYEAAVPKSEFPLAQRSELLDSVTCPLCRRIDGLIASKDDPAYRRYRRQVHINCRGIWIHVHRDEIGPDGQPTRATWVEPEGELVEKHGHFVAQPEKYAPLNVPARPTGRDFVAYRDAESGRAQLRWRDALPDRALRDTLKMVAGGFVDTATLPIVGDVELATQMMGHASERGLFTHADRSWVKHRGDWADVAGELTWDEFRTLPARVMRDPGMGFTTYTDDAGQVFWVAHSEAVALDAARTLPDVTVLYRPDLGEVDDWFRAHGRLGAPSGPPPVPFQSTEAAHAWARAAYPDIEWDLAKVHLELADEAVGEWHRLAQEYPDVAGRLRRFGVEGPSRRAQGRFAQALNEQRLIELSQIHWDVPNNLRRLLEDRVQRNWFAPGGGTPAGTVAHEFGHHVMWHLEDLGMSKSELTDFAVEHGFGDLSDYAATKLDEAYAETFMHMVRVPEGDWLSPAKALANLLRERGVI